MKTPFLILAPMAGFTDAPFRLLARRCGADFTVTEMISSVAMVYKDRKTATLAKLPLGDSPTAIQLFGHDPEIMARAAASLASGEYYGCESEVLPAAIDVNMGCPVKKIAGSGDGSALMESPQLCGEIVMQMKKALEPYHIPLTVKLRAGLDKARMNAAQVAKICADSGADAICVHARTKEELYNPGIHPEIIAQVRNAVPKNVPVFGNGDICCAEDAEKMLRDTGCDGLMVGRAALGNPWIFNEIKAHFNGEKYVPPTVSRRVQTAISLVRAIAEEKGEFTGVHEGRGRAAHFIRGLPGAAAARNRLNHAETLEEFEEIIKELALSDEVEN